MKRLMVALVAIVLVGVGQFARGDTVQWKVADGGNGHYYEAVGTGGLLSWDDAKQAAVAAGGHLVTITSQAENGFVATLVNDERFWFHTSYNRWLGPWIGAYQDPIPDEPGGENANANWRWVTEEAWDYANWNDGEPNDAGGEQDKAHFWGELQSEFGPLPVWNDAAGSGPYLPSAYVVEWENPVPEHTTLITLGGLLGMGLIGYGWRRRRKR
jgi:LPXTG-motif cell wall-anchored protein